jgi:hypothetical protein
MQMMGCYAVLKRDASERQMPHDFSHVWNLELKKNNEHKQVTIWWWWGDQREMGGRKEGRRI